VGLTPVVAGVLHDDEIPVSAGLVRALVDQVAPQLARPGKYVYVTDHNDIRRLHIHVGGQNGAWHVERG
jgi:hypothetical protein